MTKRTVWTPVADGYEYHCQCDDCVDGEDNFWQRKIYVNRDVIGVFFMDGSNENDSIHAPDNLRLCQAVELDDAPVVPDAVREAVRYVLDTAYFDISASARVDRLREWLDSLERGSDAT